MCEPKIVYDEPADVLYISFVPGASATGLSLNGHILLRVDAEERRAIGITLIGYSELADRSDIGPLNFPLSRINELSPDLQALAMELLHTQPVSDYLTVSAYSPSWGEVIPIVSVNTDKLVAHAA
jgi:uncharacterized protein YuzE